MNFYVVVVHPLTAIIDPGGEYHLTLWLNNRKVCVCVFMASRCTPRSVVGTASFKRLDGVKTYTKIYLSLLKTNLEFSGFFFRHILIVRLLSGVLF